MNKRRLLIGLMAIAIGVQSAIADDRATKLEEAFPALRQSDEVSELPMIRDETLRRTEATPEIEESLRGAEARLANAQADQANAESRFLTADTRLRVTRAAYLKAFSDAKLADNWLKELPTHSHQLDAAARVQAFDRAQSDLDTARAQLRDVIAELDEHDTEAKALANAAADARALTSGREKDMSDILAKRNEWLRGSAAARGLALQSRIILVRFADNVPPRRIRQILSDHNLEVRSGIAEIGLFVTMLIEPKSHGDNKSETQLLEDLVEKLRGVQGVVSAFVNVMLGPTAVPPPSDRSEYDWFKESAGTAPAKFMRLPAAWNFADAIRRRRGSAPRIAVLDTGFSSHVDLDFQSVCSKQSDAHGNHVLGIIGARFNNGLGVAGGCPFAQFIACAPQPGVITGDTLTLRIDENGASFYQVLWNFRQLARLFRPRLVNISLGYNWVVNFQRDGVPENTPRIQQIVNDQGSTTRALLKRYRDVLVVSAAGNDCGSRPNCVNSAKWTSPFNWAALADSDSLPQSPNVLVVASTDAAGAPSNFSNRGGMVAAPGEGIFSTIGNNGYATDKGTSLAAPAVTAVIGLMLAYNPSLTNAQIIGILEEGRQTTPQLNAFYALVRARRDSLRDLADLNNDKRVNHLDFEQFRTELLAVEGSGAFCDDLNKDGNQDDNERKFPRADLNGDHMLSRTATALVPGLGEVTDLQVMMHVWQDRSLRSDSLPSRLDPSTNPSPPAVARR